MKRAVVGWAAAFILGAGPCIAPAAPDADVLRVETQAMLDAVAPGDVDVWAERLHENYRNLDETGTVRTREELLAVLRPLPAGLEGRMEIEDYRVVFQHDTAVATYEIQEYLDYHGQPLRSRFRSMDTWLRTAEGWRMLAQHVAAVLKDPPAIQLSKAQLCAYAGEYALTNEIRTTIRCARDELASQRVDRPEETYLAETADVFFAPGQPRTRRIFLRGEDGEVEAFVDRREGEDIRWRRVDHADR